jgi:hypothetical protein
MGVEEPNAPETLAAVESLRLLGVEIPEPEATVRYLRSLADDEGGYPSLTMGWGALRALDALGTSPARSPPSGWRDGRRKCSWIALKGATGPGRFTTRPVCQSWRS